MTELILFILVCAGVTQFVSESKIGLFIREHPFIKCEKYRPYFFPITFKETMYDLLHCSMCFGFFVGFFVAIAFEYLDVNLILAKSLFGPILLGFLSSYSSYFLNKITTSFE